MSRVTGVVAKNATYEDFQRKFRCERHAPTLCVDQGLQFPRTCSHPPCDRCTVDYQSILNKTLSQLSNHNKSNIDKTLPLHLCL